MLYRACSSEKSVEKLAVLSAALSARHLAVCAEVDALNSLLRASKRVERADPRKAASGE